MNNTMSYKWFFYFLLFFELLLGSGCVRNSSSSISSISLEKDEIPVINLEKVISGEPQEFLLSDIAQRIEYIPLEFTPQCPVKIGNYWDLDVTSGDIFVLDGLIYRFDRNGKFLNRIGQHGRGPGEYVIAKNFAVDTVNRLVYVNTNEYRLMVYDYRGKYVKTVRFDGYAEFGFYFTGSTGELVATGDGYHTLSKPDNFFLKAIDTAGETRFIKKTLLSGMLKPEQETWWDLRTMQDGDDILALDCMSDTIFRYRQSTLTPYLILNYGHYKVTLSALTSAAYQEETGKYFRTGFFGSTPGYFFFSVFQTFNYKRRYDIRYNKLTGEYNYQIRKEIGADIFINDLDGGMPIAGLGKYNLKNQWILPFDAIDMKEKLTPEYFSTVKAKQRLMQLVERLGEEDNPVLMRIILK